jgi:hypothetical protein
MAMTDIELLPLPPLYIVPSVEPVDYPDVAQALMDYARANVAHATAAKDAEVEALRAEVEAWRELSDHVRVGACKAIWPDRYTDERIRDVAAALKRAERLAEALAGLITWIPSADTYRRLGFDPETPMRVLKEARAAVLWREAGND